MKKIILLFLFFFATFILNAQKIKTPEQILKELKEAGQTALNTVKKEFNKSVKQVENYTVNAMTETEKTTLNYTKSIEGFSKDLIKKATDLVNQIGKNPGDFCSSEVEKLYTMVKPILDNQTNKMKINVDLGLNKKTKQEIEKIENKTDSICKACTKNAIKTFLCRLPESIQSNIAFMDQVREAMKDSRLKDLAEPLKPIGAVAIMTHDDFINQFKTNLALLKNIQNELKKGNNGRELDVNQLVVFYSEEVCNEIGNMAFDAMLGALKGKEDPNKVKKRYEILLEKVKLVFNKAKKKFNELKVVQKGQKGFERYEKLKGYYDNAQTFNSVAFKESETKNISIPQVNPIFKVGLSGNVFINATKNGLWSDGRNWSQQMVPMSYQIAYIPKGKTVHVNRPTKVRDVINNNDNNSGISGENNISYTKNSKYLAGYTFALKNKKSNTYMAVAGDSKNNGGNLISYTNTPTHDTRNFTFLDSRDGDGSYIIKSKWSGLLIGVKGGFTFENALIEQWKEENRPNQRVFLDEAGNGYYKIRFKHTNMYLGFKDCNGAIGARFVQVKETNNDCILFRLESASLSGKTFMIQSKVDSNKYLDKSMSTADDNKIHLWQRNGNPNQKFYFRLADVDEKSGKEFYYIRNLNNYQYLINYSYGVMNGTPIVTVKDPGFNDWATMYYLEKYDDNYYYIRSRFGKNVNGKWESDRCIDVNGGNANNGTKIQLWKCNPGFNGQLFKLIEQ